MNQNSAGRLRKVQNNFGAACAALGQAVPIKCNLQDKHKVDAC